MSIPQFISRFSSRATLQIGSQGPEVKALKEVLNKFLVPSPNLVPNAAFDGQTDDRGRPLPEGQGAHAERGRRR